MDFVAVVDQVIALLRQRGRLTYRTLQRQLTIDRLARRIERLGYDGHLEPVAGPVVGEMFKATRLGALQRCGVSPAQGPVETVWHHALFYGRLERVHASSRCGRARTGHAQHATHGAEAPDVAHPDQTPDAQDDLLFPIDPDA